MYNWSIDEKQFKKQNPKAYALWRLVQRINYGLDNGKLSKSEVKRAWPNIAHELDPYKRRYLEYVLWGKLYSLPNNLRFWNTSSLKNN